MKGDDAWSMALYAPERDPIGDYTNADGIQDENIGKITNLLLKLHSQNEAYMKFKNFLENLYLGQLDTET
jgi:hypothetical protein